MAHGFLVIGWLITAAGIILAFITANQIPESQRELLHFVPALSAMVAGIPFIITGAILERLDRLIKLAENSQNGIPVWAIKKPEPDHSQQH